MVPLDNLIMYVISESSNPLSNRVRPANYDRCHPRLRGLWLLIFRAEHAACETRYVLEL